MTLLKWQCVRVGSGVGLGLSDSTYNDTVMSEAQTAPAPVSRDLDAVVNVPGYRRNQGMQLQGVGHDVRTAAQSWTAVGDRLRPAACRCGNGV